MTEISPKPVVEVSHATKAYFGDVQALKDVSLKIHPGELVAIMGPSGSGKSTLLHVLGTLDRPTSGSVTLRGRDVTTLSDWELSTLRGRSLGFVFQHFHLLDGLSATENVMLGLVYAGTRRRNRRAAARAALQRVGLSHRAHHKPHELSGGEQQRVAIARALVNEPGLVLADEPTGALDSTTGAQIMDLLRRLNDEGTTIAVVTHDQDLATRLPRRIELRDGRIVTDIAVDPAKRMSDRAMS